MTTNLVGSPPATTRDGLEVLALQDCLRLLADTPVGRVAFLDAGGPVILPVNHALDGRTIVFATVPGSKLDAAGRAATVAFEVDGYNPQTRSGWSVVVRGRADVVTEDDELARLQALNLHPWPTPPGRGHWVRIRPEEITGRRIMPDRQAPAVPDGVPGSPPDPD